MISKDNLAIVLVNYNGLNDSLECIKSLLNSDSPLKIVFVDNASKENEAEIVESSYPMVKTIRSDVNLGFAGGNNLGITWALNNNYKYIALLNNDTIVRPDTFDLLLQNANINTISAPYMYFFSHPDELWYGGGKINRWTGNAEHYYVPRKNDEPFECSFATGCCFVAHRKVWEMVGLLDESYFMYNEDSDYSIRLLRHKIKIFVVPAAKIWHKVGKSSGGNDSAFSIYYTTRNRLHMVKKYQGFFYPTAYLFSLISRYLRAFLLKRKGKKEYYAFIQGIRDAQNGVRGNSLKKVNF